MSYILVTGGAGYIGSHIALKFLQNGNFRVRCTMRSINPAKIDPL